MAIGTTSDEYNSLYQTGIRPILDEHLLELSRQKRDYGDYWSASSAGYCMRKNIFDRLGVDAIKEDARKQRIFTSGNIFHEWIQKLTKDANLSVEQELELIDDKLMIKGHIDDLIKISLNDNGLPAKLGDDIEAQHYILYDYKTQNSRAFGYKKADMNIYHKYQLGTYLYMLNTTTKYKVKDARILKISKDDLRMTEEELTYSPELKDMITDYWTTLNSYWNDKKVPACTCDESDGGFMAKEAYNPYFYNGQPCSIDWYYLWKENKAIKEKE